MDSLTRTQQTNPIWQTMHLRITDTTWHTTILVQQLPPTHRTHLHHWVIDWPSLWLTLATLPPAQQWCIAKHTTGQFGHGTKLLQWDRQDHDACPICDHTETPQHILTQTWHTTIQTSKQNLTPVKQILPCPMPSSKCYQIGAKVLLHLHTPQDIL